MWISFTSDHLQPRLPGRLSVGIASGSERGTSGHPRTVSFEVPHDFHTHNDSVAAALMTLVGDAPDGVTFNFPISEHCAATLCAYYQLEEAGPVDPGLEPRQPGRYLGMNFSGGLDSSALRALLEHLIPGEFKVISTTFEGADTTERAAQEAWPPDLRCATDFRRKGFFAGRYITAVPLLFADYLDLYGMTAAHVFSQDADSVERNVDGHPPSFLRRAPSLAAGGLEEVHLFRGIDETAVLRLLMRLAPERIEMAVRASSQPGTLRNIARRLSLRILYEWEGGPMPEIVRATDLSSRPETPGAFFSGGAPILFVIKHYGDAGARALSAGEVDMSLIDFSFLDDLTMELALKFNTNFLHYAPRHLRGRLLSLLASIDIQPFNERDWQELEALRNGLLPALIALGVIPELSA